MTAAEFLAAHRTRKQSIARLADQRDRIKRQIAEAEADARERLAAALKDGLLQVGSCYDMGDGTVAAAYRTEKGPQLSFFTKA